jgi:hypothetical protein
MRLYSSPEDYYQIITNEFHLGENLKLAFFLRYGPRVHDDKSLSSS